MKREIKFRAWDSKFEKMYYSHGDECRVNLFRGKFEIDLCTEDGTDMGCVECNKETYPLMQYTVLKDKNGVEIYEGDILKYPQEITSPAEVTINKFGMYEAYGNNVHISPQSFEVCEVIGNIYENPELLK